MSNPQSQNTQVTRISTFTKPPTNCDTAEVLGRRIDRRDKKIAKLQKRVKALEKEVDHLNSLLDFG